MTGELSEIIIPPIAGEPSEVYLAEWLASVGDEVTVGKPLLLLEADKAQVEIPAPSSGRLAHVSVQPDDPVAVGQVVGAIEMI